MYTGIAISGDYIGNKLDFSGYPIDRIFPYFGLKPFPNAWIAIWQRFDTNWYISIAERGYGAIPGDIHFPPLFPCLIRLFGLVFRDSFVAGMVVSGLAGLTCLKLLYDLFLSWGGHQEAATRGLMYFLVFPASFFLFGAYTEGLFIVAAILALESLRRSQWIYAGVCISCATLIRLQGLVLFLPLLDCLWKHKSTANRYRALFGLCAAALGIVVYLVLRAAMAGGDNVIPLAEGELYAHLAFPWENFVFALRTLVAGSMTHIDGLNFIVAVLFLGLIVGGWKEIPVEYSLYSVATYILLTIRVVDTQPFNSMLRYVLTLFPSFWVLGRWGERPILHRLILYLSFILLLFLSAQFWVWGWVA
jgi:Gpi18-like mannosyltransferase